MQTTLLGLGITIILALVAALVGPYFVDWTEHRSLFEAQASRMVGMPVRITGRIDARLLPVPSLRLRGLEARSGAGAARFVAQEISVEFALGALMRGEWRAGEMRIVGPSIGIGLGADGRVDWSENESRIDPDSLSIERLTIEDGRVILADAASASSITLDKFWFTGDLRSLAGPIKGEGGFATGDESHAYRLTAGRMSQEAGMRVRLALDPADRPLSTELEGTLRVENGTPSFEGGLTLARSGGVSLIKGRAVANESWRLSSRIKASTAGALFEQVEAQYGPEDRPLKINGTAELKFGMRPRLDILASARQLDLDRFVALPERTRRLPLVALQSAADMLSEVLAPSIPVRIGLGIDVLTLADATLQTVRGDFSADAAGWNIETLEFRAPGATQIRASGRIARSSQGQTFTGPATIESTDPRAFVAWLEGRPAAAATQLGALRASGDVTLAADRVAIDRLQAELDQRTLAGRLSYLWGAQGQRPRFEAELKAAELDLDAAATLLRAALPGLSLDLPTEVMLAVDIGRATMGGIAAVNARAKLKLDANGLTLEQATIGDLGGAAVELSGRVQGPWTTPRGALTLAVAGNRLDGVLALLDQAAPQAAAAIRDVSGRLSPVKLQMTLALDHASSATAGTTSIAKFRLSGTAGSLRVAVSGDVSGNPFDLQVGYLRADGSLEADQGGTVAGFFGLERVAAVGNGPGSLRFTAAGPLTGTLGVQSRLIAAGIDLTANGTLRLDGAGGVAGGGEISATFADAASLRPLLRPAQPAPLALKARLAFGPDRVALDNITAKLADSTLTGRLALTLGGSARVDGRIDANVINAAALLGAIAGMPHSGRGAAAAAGWPNEPFGSRFLADRAGQIEFSAARATVSPSLEIGQLRGLLRIAENEAVFENVQGVVAGGQLVGNASFQSSAGTTVATMTIGLTNADVAALLPGDTRAPVTGRLNLHLEAKGSGRTPAALAGTLGGAGTVSLERLELAGFDPQAFDVLVRSTDQGFDIDAVKIKEAAEKLLDRGRLKVARAEGSLTITAGQLRLGGMAARGERADLGVNASVDLVQWLLDARLALLGSAAEASLGRPEISVTLKGPLAAPKRSVDVSALVGWLTLRAVDLQAKRVEAAEAQQKAAEDAARRIEESTRRANEEAAKRAAEAAARRAAEESARRVPPSASSPPVGEQAPTLPPPVDIRPLPGQRHPSAQRLAPQPGLLPEQEVDLRPAPGAPRPPPHRTLMDSLFGR